MPNMLLIIIGVAAITTIVCIACDPSFIRKNDYEYDDYDEEDFEE